MPDPRLDVLMTVYNGEDYLETSIQSVLEQTVTDFVLHVVDDGSTDDTPAILAKLAATDSRLRIYRQANSGVVAASNYGLAQGHAAFVARQDADDISFPDRFEKQLNLFATRPDLLAVSANAYRIDMSGKRLVRGSIVEHVDDADTDYYPAKEPYVLHPFLMIRRRALEAIGGYRPLPVSEDTDLYWRVQEIGSICSEDDFYGEYRMNPVGLSSRSVRSGRVMSVSSQLAAISATRRRAGLADLELTPQFASLLQAHSTSLDSICAVARPQLSDAENSHLRCAVSAKLLEMAGYRPYEIELSDCIFIRAALNASKASIGRSNAAEISRNLSGTAARLATSGRWAEAWALLGGTSLAPFFLKVLGRVLLPERLHVRLRNLFARGATS